VGDRRVVSDTSRLAEFGLYCCSMVRMLDLESMPSLVVSSVFR
jgi:hypothetical protein